MKKKPKQEIIFLFSFKIQLSQQAKSSHNETSLTYFRFEEKKTLVKTLKDLPKPPHQKLVYLL